MLNTLNSSTQKIESGLTTLETTIKKAQSELDKQPSILGEIRATILEQNKTLMKEHHEQMKAMSQELMKTLELLKTELLAESKRVAKQEAQNSLGLLKGLMIFLGLTNLVLIVVFLLK